MKKIQLLILFYFITLISTNAFEIKGKITVKDGYGKPLNGHTVYLWKNIEGQIHEEWTGMQIIDSCKIVDQKLKRTYALGSQT